MTGAVKVAATHRGRARARRKMLAVAEMAAAAGCSPRQLWYGDCPPDVRAARDALPAKAKGELWWYAFEAEGQ